MAYPEKNITILASDKETLFVGYQNNFLTIMSNK